MFKFQVIEVENPQWAFYLNLCVSFDFYHTQCYHAHEKLHRPVLLVSSHFEDFIAIPLIIRKIDNYDYYDCTSAYGYCGPISNLSLEDIPPVLINSFLDQLTLFFKSNRIVTVFSRLHPILNNGKILSGLGTIENVNKTIAIDLTLSLAEQRTKFRKSNKSEINQLRNRGFQVIRATTEEQVLAFIDVYEETMNRLAASQHYYFNWEYYKSFLQNDCFQSVILLAVFDGVVTAGAIFTFVDKVMQYHLAGTKTEFIKLTPMKLIIDEARSIGMEYGCRYLHLGGGVGGSDNDSLYRFKAGFSDLNFDFGIWKAIVDDVAYEFLINQEQKGRELNTSYFPVYRS